MERSNLSDAVLVSCHLVNPATACQSKSQTDNGSIPQRDLCMDSNDPNAMPGLRNRVKTNPVPPCRQTVGGAISLGPVLRKTGQQDFPTSV